MEHCPFAFRERGKPPLMCAKVRDDPRTREGQTPYCMMQYLCPVTDRWENTTGASRCRKRVATPAAEPPHAVDAGADERPDEEAEASGPMTKPAGTKKKRGRAGVIAEGGPS